MDKPTYIHDCKHCTYLGSGIGGRRRIDYYACIKEWEGKDDTDLVARYGDDGPDYLSGTAMQPPTLGGHAELIVCWELYKKHKREEGRLDQG